MPTIAEGDRFPHVSGKTFQGEQIDLSGYAGKRNVVLYFYPRDLTPGCTREAIDFDRKLADFDAHDTTVIGMSVDPLEAHQTFTTSCGLHFPLLSDEGGALSDTLGIKADQGYSRRTTFVIDKTGVVRKVFEVQGVDGHVDQVLEAVRSLA